MIFLALLKPYNNKAGVRGVGEDPRESREKASVTLYGVKFTREGKAKAIASNSHAAIPCVAPQLRGGHSLTRKPREQQEFLDAWLQVQVLEGLRHDQGAKLSEARSLEP